MAFSEQFVMLLEKRKPHSDNQIKEMLRERFFVGALRLAVLGLNYGSKIAYYAKNNIEVDLVA